MDLPALSEKDKKDLAWGVGQEVDMVFASFIRKASDVQEVRRRNGVKRRLTTLHNVQRGGGGTGDGVAAPSCAGGPVM